MHALSFLIPFFFLKLLKRRPQVSVFYYSPHCSPSSHHLSTKAKCRAVRYQVDCQDNQTDESLPTTTNMLKSTTADVLTLASAFPCLHIRTQTLQWIHKFPSKLYWANCLTGCDRTQKTAHGPSGLHLSQIILLYQTAR